MGTPHPLPPLVLPFVSLSNSQHLQKRPRNNQVSHPLQPRATVLPTDRAGSARNIRVPTHLLPDFQWHQIPAVHGTPPAQRGCDHAKDLRAVRRLCDQEPFLSDGDAREVRGI